MKRGFLPLVLLVTVAACSPAGEGGEGTTTSGADATTTTILAPDTTSSSAPVTTTTTIGEGSEFPVTVADDLGQVTIEEMPEAVVSLSSVATEMLFAIGAGEQVIAVDNQSNYPEDAPMTDLSGFTPNVEAILSYEPDLVVISFDPGDLVSSLAAAGVPVLTYVGAFSLDDTFHQIEALGAATGHAEDAVFVNEQIQTDLAKIVADTPQVPEGTDYYHEVDNTFYTATSTTFIGQIYTMFGLENIADEADADGSASGFPQLSSEYIVEADPDLVFLGNSLYGESVETVGARPGWDVMTAVSEGSIVELDSDVVSRWGPRIVDFAYSISDALIEYVGES